MKQLANAFPDATVRRIDPRFNLVNRWTYLMLQVYECGRFLDLAETTHAVHLKSSLDELLVQQALFRSFLLSYGKCFASSGTGRSSLDLKVVFAHEPALRSVHNRIIHLRNRFAAHNAMSGLDDAAIVVEEREEEYVITQRYAMANPLHEYDQFRQALRALENYVAIQSGKALKSIERKLNKRVRVKSAG